MGSIVYTYNVTGSEGRPATYFTSPMPAFTGTWTISADLSVPAGGIYNFRYDFLRTSDSTICWTSGLSHSFGDTHEEATWTVGVPGGSWPCSNWDALRFRIDTATSNPPAGMVITVTISGAGISAANYAAVAYKLTVGATAAGTDERYIPKSIVTTKGDLIAATGTATPVRLGVGTNGYVLTADSTESTGIKWAAAAGGGGGSLTTASSSLSSDLNSSAGGWGDVVSVSLVAGTWVVWSTFTGTISSATGVESRISDGTTHYASGGMTLRTNTDMVNIALSAVMTLASTTTIKLQYIRQSTVTVRAALVNSPSGNNATQINALKVG